MSEGRLMAQPSLFIYRRRHRTRGRIHSNKSREVQRRRRCARPTPVSSRAIACVA